MNLRFGKLAVTEGKIVMNSKNWMRLSSASADNTLRELRNSSDHCQGEINYCFLIYSKQFII